MTLAVFHDFPGLDNGLTKFHDFPGRVVTLSKVLRDPFMLWRCWLGDTKHIRPIKPLYSTVFFWNKQRKKRRRFLLPSSRQHQSYDDCLDDKRKDYQTRMWANVQRDGRPAEYRWYPLFNAANFGWRPLLECRAVTLPGRESCWNLQGCLKLANRSQPLGGRSSPYYEDVGEVSVFNKFFKATPCVKVW